MDLALGHHLEISLAPHKPTVALATVAITFMNVAQ